MTTLQLLSDTPLFHGLAIAVIEDSGDCDLTQFLKVRMADLRVGDPHLKEKPMLAITASKKVTSVPETDIPTATLPQIKPELRLKPARSQPIDATVLDWNPNA